MNHDEDLWLVKLDDGHVRSMTLDELDAAFQSDEIHERTMICRDGGDRWITLAEELGLESPTTTPTPPAPAPPPSVTASVSPVARDIVDDDDHDHKAFSGSRKGTRVIAILLGTIVLGAFGAFATLTAVNASRTRARAALASQLAAAAALEARAHDNDPEPEATTQTRDSNKPQTRERRRNTKNQGNGTQQAPQDKPAGTVFTTGGDDHDPLNAKL
jgi:hypothetical protein